MVVGIRPEDFSADDDIATAGQRHALSVHVDVLESTGSDVYLHVPLDPSQADAIRRLTAGVVPEEKDTPLPVELIARLPSVGDIREGQAARLWIDTRKIHLFDADTLERLGGV